MLLICKRKNLFLSRIFIVVVITLFLGGCLANLEQVKKENLDHLSRFNKYLVKGYIKFASLQASKYNWNSSSYFADKAREIIKGREVLPEEIEYWNLKGNTEQIKKAREDLIDLLKEIHDLGFKEDIAKMQLLFDCWVNQQSKNLNYNDQKYCKFSFLKKLSEMQLQRKGIYKNFVFEYVYDVLFGMGVSTVASYTVIDKVIENANLLKDYRIYLEGYADSVGSQSFNKLISKKRVLDVRKKLISKGIKKDHIFYNFFGEDKLLVYTLDNVPEPANRHVIIRLKGRK